MTNDLILAEIKLLLGESATNYTDELIKLCFHQAENEIESYCHRNIDSALELIAERMAVIKLNRLGTEGLAAQGYSGVSESYIDGYPADIVSILNSKRRARFL